MNSRVYQSGQECSGSGVLRVPGTAADVRPRELHVCIRTATETNIQGKGDVRLMLGHTESAECYYRGSESENQKCLPL